MPKDIRQWIGNYKHISLEPTEEDFAWVVDMLDEMVKKKIASISSTDSNYIVRNVNKY